jgi:FkbM family methyltransferase
MPADDQVPSRAPMRTIGITAQDVTACIEFMLGRTPSRDLVDYHLGLNFPDRAALGRYMATTLEFAARYHDVDYAVEDFTDHWRGIAVAAAVRRNKLRSFGPRARGILVEGTSEWYVVDPEDRSVSRALLEDGFYGREEYDLAISLLPQTGSALIVGTHIGGLAIPLAKRCARLDAVEANPRTQMFLRANLKLNDSSNVEMFAMAASSKTETLEFLLNRDNSGGSKRKPVGGDASYYYDDPEVVQVQARAMDEVLAGRSYDLILIDCEGSEYFALQGMQGILSRSGVLSIEFLRHHIENVGGTDIGSFIDQIEPHFSWLYVPVRNELIGKADIRSALTAMFDRGEGHDGLYFLKQVPADWAAARGLNMGVGA